MIGVFIGEKSISLECGPVFAGKRCRLLTLPVKHRLPSPAEWGFAFSSGGGPTLWLFYGLACKPVSLVPRWLKWVRRAS